MTIRKFANYMPSIASSVYIDDMAFVSGQTTIGEESSVWPMAVIRGDVNFIKIGKRSNIQDGAVLHVTHANPESTFSTGSPLIIGDNVTVGHNATLHACTIGNNCLIGMGSVILDKAIVEDNVMIAAGSLVPPKKVLASGYLYLGNPIKQTRPLNDDEIAFLGYSAKHYVDLAKETKNN